MPLGVADDVIYIELLYLEVIAFLAGKTAGWSALILWTGQWIESLTDWAIRITDWGLFPDWVSSHARLADAIQPRPNNGKSPHSGLPIAVISRLPDWVMQSVLPIAIHRLLHRFYPLARERVLVAQPRASAPSLSRYGQSKFMESHITYNRGVRPKVKKLLSSNF